MNACAEPPAPAYLGLPGSVRPAGENLLSLPETVPRARLDSLLAEAGYLEADCCAEGGVGAWRIRPGRRVAGVWLAWEGARVPEAPPEAPGWRIAMPAADGISAAVQTAVRNLLAAQREAGYPLARAAVRGFTVDSLLTLHLAWEPGPAVVVTELGFVGTHRTRPAFLRRWIAWRGAEPFRDTRWRRARDGLAATQLFRSVEGPLLVPLGAQHRLGADEGWATAGGDTLAVRAVFRLMRQRVSRFEGLLGYAGRGAGEARLSGYLDLELGNLFGTGRRAHLFWQGLGEDRSRAVVEWHEPFLWRLPIGADLALSHLQEDTLYAETHFGGDLVWRPAPRWQIGVGWRRERVVFGDSATAALHRDTNRFRVRRQDPRDPARGFAWALSGELSQTRGGGPTQRRVMLAVREARVGARWGCWLEQIAALVTGVETLLRGDALGLGGTATLRGSYEDEYRAFGYLVGRTEFGRRLTGGQGRVYLLADLAWWEGWRADPGGLLGRRGDLHLRWAAGFGLSVASRAGRVRLDYAVPQGASVWEGRLHFGVAGDF